MYDEDRVIVTPDEPDKREEAPRPTVYERYSKRNYLAFWIIGLINNFHYCLVLSAASNIAESFHLKSYIALVSWSNVMGGLVVRMLNAFVFDAMPYKRRYIIMGIQTLLGLVLVMVSPYCGSNDTAKFAIALVGVLNVGNGSSWGESVTLGYIERFPSRFVGAWSSGTGMSGVIATVFYMAMRAASLSNTTIFGISAVLVGLYWGAFYFILITPSANDDEVPKNNWTNLSWVEPELVAQTDPERQGLVNSVRELEDPTVSAVDTPPVRWWKTPRMRFILEVHNLAFFNNVNLALVYIFEYAIQFVTPFCFPCYAAHSDNFLLSNSFVITQFCYQCGVLISRSSLACVRIRKVWVLTILQLVNVVFWFTQAKVLFLSSDEESKEVGMAVGLFLLMVFVGLMGGASYVNVFYNILELTSGEAESKERRQMAMNIGALYAVLGITVGSAVDLVFSNTVLDSSCP